MKFILRVMVRIVIESPSEAYYSIYCGYIYLPVFHNVLFVVKQFINLGLSVKIVRVTTEILQVEQACVPLPGHTMMSF